MAHWRLGGWLSRLFSSRRRPARDAREARAVIEAYATCLERRAAGRFSRERDLPYSKEVIGRVILRALEVATDERVVIPLRQGFVDLETFLTDAEWAIVEEYERLAGASWRPEAGAAFLAQVEERKERRRRLLDILEQERAARTAGGNGRG
jgi:hypothetical protein